jgi:hypothetical protein
MEQVMPRDEHQRNRDRDHQRKANQELVTFGQLRSYEHAYDSDAASKDERFSLVDFLNCLRKKAATQLQERIPVFKNLPESGDTSSIPLLAYGLEGGVEHELVSLTELVEQIGPLAVKELCRLLLYADGEKFLYALWVIKRLNNPLSEVAIQELRKQAVCDNKEQRQKALRGLNELRLVNAQPLPVDEPLIAYLNSLLSDAKGMQKLIPVFTDLPKEHDSRWKHLLPLGLKSAGRQEIELLRRFIMRIGWRAAKSMCSLAFSESKVIRANALKVIQKLGPELDRIVSVEMSRLSQRGNGPPSSK